MGGVLVGGGTCTVVVAYTPTGDEKNRARLKFTYDDGVNSQTDKVEMSGRGFYPVIPAPPGDWDWKISGIPMGSTSSDHTPLLIANQVRGVAGDQINIYSHQNCQNKVASYYIVNESESIQFPITHNSDGSDDGLRNYYAKVISKDGLESQCSHIANYILDTQQGLSLIHI